MENGIEYFYFFRNWWMMAEVRDTDEKRLAFYDAIFRYVFEGTIPEKPVRGQSSGKVWAAYDAYLATVATIDQVLAKIKARSLAGKAGKGVSRNKGNQNALKAYSIQKQNKDNTETIQKQSDKDKDKDKDKDNVFLGADAPKKTQEQDDPVVIAEAESYRECKKEITLQEIQQWCIQLNIPSEYAKQFLQDMKELDWGYCNRNGVFVKVNRQTCKSVIKSFYKQFSNKQTNSKVSVLSTTKERFMKEGFDASFLDG